MREAKQKAVYGSRSRSNNSRTVSLSVIKGTFSLASKSKADNALPSAGLRSNLRWLIAFFVLRCEIFL